MKKWFCCFGLSLLLVAPVSAADNGFETSADGMLEQLTTKPKEPVSTMPQVRLRGRPMHVAPAAPVQLRSVKRVSHAPSGKVIQEIAQVPVQETHARVNLKVEFDVNSASIRSGSYAVLAELGKALNDPTLQGRSFYINGHTDSDGSDQYNLNLSLQRAQAVKQFLVAGTGVQGHRLNIAGYGEGMPLNHNSTPTGKQMNRRVEVVVR